MITVAYEINTYIDVSIDTAAVKKKNIVNFFCQPNDLTNYLLH